MRTTDQRNPGRRDVARYSVSGALATNAGNQETRGIEFVLLKNCLIDKRLNAVLKRPGSSIEVLPNGLGTPLGAGEFTTASTTGVIPTNRTILVNFGGTRFFKNQAGLWSEVTVNARCSFSTDRQTQYAKIGSNMFIAGGLPAKWGGGTGEIDRVGIVAPTAAITIVSTASAGSVTLVSGGQYVYTYFNSLSGLESDWSPISASTGVTASKQIEIAIPAAAAANWDSIRIYRTFDGGIFPYFVATVVAGTVSYTDNKTDAQLAAKAAKQYEKKTPPSRAYVCAKYANCIWYIDADNPYKLQFSKPYTGSDVDLEYYPVDNYLISTELVTGLVVVPGKMLVFHPRSISFISGYSVDDFVFQPFLPGVGTVFPNSVSTSGTEIVFLAEQGFVSIPASRGEPRHISREIDLDLQPLLAGSYNSSLYVSTAWNPSLRQFLLMVTAQSTVGAPWVDSITGVTALWQNSATLIDDIWEDASGVNSANLLRVKLWGWSPELSKDQRFDWMEYEFPDIQDQNASGNYPVFLFHPQPSADTADPQQDKTFVGVVAGSANGVRTYFRRDKNTDQSSSGTALITSVLITGRIVPGDQQGGYKYFHELGFTSAYADPTSDTLATLKYLIDFEDPHLRDYASSLVTFSENDDLKVFPSALGRHVHLYLIDTSQSQSKPLLTEFFVHFRERFRREGR